MKNFISDKKALAAIRILKTYCQERACDSCIFHGKESKTCLLDVKSPDCFPAINERKDFNGIK